MSKNTKEASKLKLKNPYDNLFKYVFGIKENLNNFLIVFLSSFYTGLIDFNNSQLVDKTIVNASYSEVFPDFVVSCDAFPKTGDPTKSIIFIEEQTKHQKNMIFRLRKYVFSYEDMLIRNLQKENKSIKLPYPIVIIIHPGQRWLKISLAQDFIAWPYKEGEKVPPFKIIMFNTKGSGEIINKFNAELRAFFKTIEAAASKKIDIEYEEIIKELKHVWSDSTNKDNATDFINKILIFALNYLHKSNKEAFNQKVKSIIYPHSIGSPMESALSALFSEAITETTAKVTAKVAAETKADYIIELLNSKFGPISKTLESKIKKITDNDKLNKLFKKAIHSKSIDDFKKSLKMTLDTVTA
ncbi:MAG: Rpn family recombination-promoting nuclease/putative transposase [Deltaproteobacteria bacterium]|jgi:predicted transposase/invertase (TIGR01784 family)|nr:Rpn family recombination-promoting nuclease/putative transposase [Deltaproteobacteria bacterium]